MRAAGVAAALAVALLGWGLAQRSAVGQRPRRLQHAMEWLETAPGASADAFRVLSRDPGACSFEQLVRGGTPGYDPQVSDGGAQASCVRGTLRLARPGRT